jgi:quercetin dioxygenase-like cupin family protein
MEARTSSDPSEWRTTHEADALSAPVMKFDMAKEIESLTREPRFAGRRPVGRTLVKEPDLRVVLVALKASGRMEEHNASGPTSIQAIGGTMRLILRDRTVELAAGDLLIMEPGVMHDLEALEDCAFLITMGRTTYPLLHPSRDASDAAEASTSFSSSAS